MLDKIINGLVVLAAILFLSFGARWLVAPAGIVDMFGFPLADGLGLSSQVGDMSAYFFTASICMLLGVFTKNRTWLYPPLILLSLTAFGRVIAWLVHGATLATGIIAFEVITALLLWVAAKRQAV